MNTVRWVARILGILYALMWLSQVPGILQYSSIPLPIPVQVVLMVSPAVLLPVGPGGGRRWGGLVHILSIVAIYILVASVKPAFRFGPATIVRIPGLLAGALFIICGYMRGTNSESDSA